MTIAALEHGCHVVLEKPMTTRCVKPRSSSGCWFCPSSLPEMYICCVPPFCCPCPIYLLQLIS